MHEIVYGGKLLWTSLSRGRVWCSKVRVEAYEVGFGNLWDLVQVRN